MDVHLFIPCFIDQLYPQTAINMVNVLRRLGCRVQYNPAQTCCGQPAFNAGFWEESRAVGEKFVKDFANAPVIVCPSASCVGFIRQSLNEVLKDSPLLPRLAQIQTRILEFSEFLVDKLQIADVGAQLHGKATYHDSCAALRECHIKTAPRQLLANVKGLELIESSDCETCCGFGGTFSVKFEPISVAMAEQKVENALALGVQYLISTDISCLMHLQGCIDHKQYPLRTLHIADVLANQH